MLVFKKKIWLRSVDLVKYFIFFFNPNMSGKLTYNLSHPFCVETLLMAPSCYENFLTNFWCSQFFVTQNEPEILNWLSKTSNRKLSRNFFWHFWLLSCLIHYTEFPCLRITILIWFADVEKKHKFSKNNC